MFAAKLATSFLSTVCFGPVVVPDDITLVHTQGSVGYLQIFTNLADAVLVTDTETKR